MLQSNMTQVHTQTYLLGAPDHGYQALWLSCLCCLINEHMLEAEGSQPVVPSANTGGADDLCMQGVAFSE
jgi:hypothetical protein